MMQKTVEADEMGETTKNSGAEFLVKALKKERVVQCLKCLERLKKDEKIV